MSDDLKVEPCCDCGAQPLLYDDAATVPEGAVRKWYECTCGRAAQRRGCSTRLEAAKKWNKTMRFLVSYRSSRRDHKV